MNVLCRLSDVGGQTRSICESWGRVFTACGDRFTLWNPLTKPAFDAFDESQPHLYLGEAVVKCLRERPSTRVFHEERPQPAGDTFLYGGGGGGQARPDLVCDVAYTGRRTLRTIPYVMAFVGNTSIKIMGDDVWGIPQYLGRATPASIRDLYCTGRVSLHVSEDGRTGEEVYNILLAGGACVSSVLTDAALPPEIVPQGRTPKEVWELALTMDAIGIASRGREVVLGGHTYWHRVRDILIAVGLPREAARVMEVYRATVAV